MILFVLRRLVLAFKAVCRQFFITFSSFYPMCAVALSLFLSISFHACCLTLSLFHTLPLSRFRQSAFRTFDIVCELKCKTCATHNFYKYWDAVARQILHAIFVKIFTWTHGLLDDWWLQRISFRHTIRAKQKQKQSNAMAKQRVLRSLYLIYLRTCAYVSPSTHRFVILLSWIVWHINKMKWRKVYKQQP